MYDDEEIADYVMNSNNNESEFIDCIDESNLSNENLTAVLINKLVTLLPTDALNSMNYLIHYANEKNYQLHDLLQLYRIREKILDDLIIASKDEEFK